MPTGRSLFSLVVANNFIYAIGGQNKETTLATVDRYDVKTNVWAAVRPMLYPRAAAAAVVFKNHIYVIGGTTQWNACETASVERFNLETETWTAVRRNRNQKIA